MIQLNKSLALNTFAFYPDVPVSASTDLLYIDWYQDYNKNSGSLYVQVVSNATTTPWVICEMPGASVPNPSGQYTFEFYQTVDDAFLPWEQVDTEWNLLNQNWDDIKGRVITDFVAEERAFISGSDVTSIPEYVSSYEPGYYTTYIG
jgi:DNA-dependent RNA polymerase auxiliary subunit epsilon